MEQKTQYMEQKTQYMEEKTQYMEQDWRKSSKSKSLWGLGPESKRKKAFVKQNSLYFLWEHWDSSYVNWEN